MKIKTRIKIIIISAIIVLSAMISMKIFMINQTGNLVKREAFIDELNFNIYKSNLIRDNYFLYKTKRSKQQWFAIDRIITEQFKSMQELFADSAEKKDMEIVFDQYSRISKLFNQLVSHDQSDREYVLTEKIREMIINQMIGEAYRLYEQCFILSRDISYKMEQQTLYSAVFSMLSLGILGFVIILFSRLTIQNVTVPLSRMKEGTKLIAGGKFDYRLNNTATDEIGDLARDFDHMTEQLALITVSHDELNKINDNLELEITEHEIAEDKIKSLLKEKEIILREVNHRIKNNMNTIYNLLVLQSDTVKDPSAVKALLDAASRVQSMLLLYDKLYQSADFQNVSVLEYLPALVDEIVMNFSSGIPVKVEKKIEDFSLDAKRLQPLGIIINELFTNIMKYAFTGRSNGLITISAGLKPAATPDQNCVFLIIEDNGNGIPESVSFDASTGFGLMLVGMLTKQIDGTILIEREKGTKIIIEFNL